MSTQDQTLLILFGAPSGPERRIVHLAVERGGELVPRCNTHYRASQDIGPRRFREAVDDELTYPVCQRCRHMRPDRGTMTRYPSREAALEAHPTSDVYQCTICSKWHCS